MEVLKYIISETYIVYLFYFVSHKQQQGRKKLTKKKF